MTIFKQLFLITILGVNFGFIGAHYNYNHQEAFNFAAILKYGAVDKQDNSKIMQENKALAEWLIGEIKNHTLSELVILTINSYHLTFEQKIESLKKIKPTFFKSAFKKGFPYISAGLINTAKFTAAITSIVAGALIIPGLVEFSTQIGKDIATKFIKIQYI